MNENMAADSERAWYSGTLRISSSNKGLLCVLKAVYRKTEEKKKTFTLAKLATGLSES